MNISTLSEKQIKEYSPQISADKDFFVDEEVKLKEWLTRDKNNEISIKKEIKDLGTAKYPGSSPDVEDYVKPTFHWSFWPYLIGLILVFAFHCVIWVIKLLFDIPWDTWGWTKCFFWYGLIFIVSLCAIALAIYGIMYWLWKRQLDYYHIWKENKERLEKKLDSTKKNI